MSISLCRILPLFLILCAGLSSLSAEREVPRESLTLDQSVDELTAFPEVWKLSTADFEALYTQTVNGDELPLYEWMDREKNRARITRQLFSNVKVDLTLIDESVPVEEVVVDFVDGTVDFVSISIFNRGDAEKISHQEFERRRMAVGKHLTKALSAKPRRRKANSKQGLFTEGFFWKAPGAIALIEHNENPTGGKLEFLRVRMASPASKAPLTRALLHARGGASIRSSELPKNVVKDASSEVYIGKLPMVDQGSKGYCVCATVQRVFEYYGIGVDMHQIAQIADADPERGTSSFEMGEQLDRIDFRFKTRLKIIAFMTTNGNMHRIKAGRDRDIGKPFDFSDFESEVIRNIDRGIPLLWSMEVGRVEENPPLSEQASGGHMRLIIGYDKARKRLLFSDSWGAGHDKKWMDINDAYRVSRGLFSLTPTK